jgi:protein serine kinase H
MAPEIIKKLPYTSSVDIWALGVLTYIMLSGKPPFKGRCKDDVFIEITTKNISYTGDTWKNISKEAKNFIRKMLI